MKCTIIQQTLVCNAAENSISKSLDFLDIQYNSYSAIGFYFSRATCIGIESDSMSIARSSLILRWRLFQSGMHI